MAPRGHQCSHWTIEKGWTDVQDIKIQDHDLPDGGNLHGISDKAFSWRNTGEGDIYREHLQRRIPCTYCRVELTAGSMTAHHIILHGKDPSVE